MNSKLYKTIAYISLLSGVLFWAVMFLEVSKGSGNRPIYDWVSSLGGPKFPLATESGPTFFPWMVTGLPFCLGIVFSMAGGWSEDNKVRNESSTITLLLTPALVIASIALSALLAIPTGLVFSILAIPFMLVALFGGGIEGWFFSLIVLMVIGGTLLKEPTLAILIIFRK